MKKTPIGHCDCPVCGFDGAQVKEDKNAHAYIHCTDCNAQTFTRNEHRNSQLRKRMRPVTVTVAAPEAEPPAPVASVPAKVVPPAAPAKKPWFQPLMAGGANG